jgi:hypothetical protein
MIAVPNQTNLAFFVKIIAGKHGPRGSLDRTDYPVRVDDDHERSML